MPQRSQCWLKEWASDDIKYDIDALSACEFEHPLTEVFAGCVNNRLCTWNCNRIFDRYNDACLFPVRYLDGGPAYRTGSTSDENRLSGS
jgi:hypothetical protein